MSATLIIRARKRSTGAAVSTSIANGEHKRIILASPTETKVTSVIDEIKKPNPAVETDLVELDLLDNLSVRKVAKQINVITSTVYGMVNNARAMVVRNLFQVTGWSRELICGQISMTLTC